MAASTRSSGKKLRSRVIVKLHPASVKFRVSERRIPKRKEEEEEHEVIDITSDDEDLRRNERTQAQNDGMTAAGSDDLMISITEDEWNDVQQRLRQADMAAEHLRTTHRTIGTLDRIIRQLTNQREAAQKSVISNRERLLDHLACFTCGELLRDPYILPSCGHTFCHGCITSWGRACGRARAQLRGDQIDPADPPFYLRCPVCRVHEDNPIQNFFVKSLVASITEEELV